MYIDTHAHLYLEQFKEDIDEVIQRARDNRVEKIFLPNIDIESITFLKALTNQYPDTCYPLMGLHPCSVKGDYKEVLAEMHKLLVHEKYYGIGETGIDLYWDISFKKEQVGAFEIQIQWAKENALPVIIHSRESLDLTIEIIGRNVDADLTGIFHCFNGTIAQYEKISELGFFVGLGGVITYKNANLDEMLSAINLQNVVLETDAPYLSPAPFRGKRNESAYIPFVAQKIATVKGLSVEEIMELTTEAAKKIYKLEC
jgi:TatD DNase family protein